MNLLDIRTIVFGNAMIFMVCTAVMVMLWRQTRERFAGVTFWVVNFVLQTLAIILLALRGNIPDWASITITHALMMGGALLIYMGLERFIGKKSAQVHNYLFLAVVVLVHAYFTFLKPDLSARNLNTSVGLLIIFTQCVWLLLYRVAPNMRAMTRGVGLIFGLYCLASTLRIVQFYIFPQERTDFFQSDHFNALMLFFYQILFILLTYGLVLMSHRRLLVEIHGQEENFAKVFHSSPFAVAIMDFADGRIMEVNEEFLRMTGYDGAAVKGAAINNLNLWVRQEDRTAVIDELTATGKARTREIQLRKKTGEEMTGLLSAETLTDNNKKYILSSINDITVRKKMESELQRNGTLIRTVMDNLPIGIAVNAVDPAVTFNYVNDYFATCYRTSKEVVGSPEDFWEAAYEDPRLRKVMKTRVLTDLASGDPARMYWPNIPITRAGEPTTYITARNIPIPAEGLMLSTVWDVTQQRRTEEEIRTLNEQLEQKVTERTQELRDSQTALRNIVNDLNRSAKSLTAANNALEAVNRELEAFSYSVSHDLRAPLRSIDGFSLALIEDYGDILHGAGLDHLQRIRKATHSMGYLIDDLLKLSRVTRNDINHDTVDLSIMVEKTVETIRQNNRQRSVDVEIQKGVTIWADRYLMQIAVMNLLDNAWKFTMREASPKIAFGADILNGETAYFVRDNGVGFDMRDADKLFEAFQRLHQSDEFRGTGVGLATVQRIIHRHGGRIWTESQPGKGATFFFTLGTPLARGKA
jgi:PAS domain S-box-containing protein